MPLALRTRLTLWYSALLLFGIALFSATILWLHWRLVLEQSDESLRQLSGVAANVVSEELNEGAALVRAAHEVESVVRNPDYAVAVLDGSGGIVLNAAPGVPLPVPRVERGR